MISPSFAARALNIVQNRVEPDPIVWARRKLGFHPWSKQQEVIEALKNHRYVSVRSSNGVGKTTISAVVGLHHSLLHKGRDSQVVCIGASWSSLFDSLHARMLNFHGDYDLPGEFLSNFMRLDKKRVIVFKSPPKSSVKKSRKLLQGPHPKHLLVLVEEANEIPASLWAEILSLCTTNDCRVLAIGNPTETGTPFYGTFQDGADWFNIHISAFDSPHFTGEDVPPEVLEALPNKAWVDKMQRELASWEYTARVLGKFPKDSEFTFFEESIVNYAMRREGRRFGPVFYGFDPGSGGDASKLARREGSIIEMIPLGDYEHSSDREAVAAKVADCVAQGGGDSVVVDTFGVGADHALTLGRLLSDIPVYSLNTGDVTKLVDPGFVNPRSELAGECRRLMRGQQLTIPNDPEIKRQLSSIRQKPHVSGRVALEPKAEAKNRLGRSPDDIDAMFLTLYNVSSGETWDDYFDINEAGRAT